MTEEKMIEMAAYYEKEEISRGVALVVIMLDDMKHQVLDDGSISHCLDITCPCWDEQEEEPEDDLERRMARQAEQHLSDRGYFDMWGLHEDDEPWHLSRPNQSDWLVE